MRHITNLLMLFSGALALAACSQYGSSNYATPFEESVTCESTTLSATGIVQGSIVTATSQPTSSTVLIIYMNSKNEQSVCTGTLIDRDKVLTAAHCSPPDTSAIYLAFTNNSACIGADPVGILRVIDKVTIHPDYKFESTQLENAANDLAVMGFQGGLAPGYSIEPLPQMGLKISSDDHLTMLGYGDTLENAKNAGVLRMTSASASRLQKSFFVELTQSRHEIPKTLALLQDSNGVCTGDSGGPLFVHQNQERPLLVGLTSMGIDHRAKDRRTTRVCHGISLFTDLRTHLPWLQLQLAQ